MAPHRRTTTEGSGLIDIRALASSLAATRESKGRKAEVDDLLGIGVGPGLMTPLSSQVVLPEPRRRIRAHAPLVAAGLLGVAIVSSAVFVGALLSRPPQTRRAPAPEIERVAAAQVEPLADEPPPTPESVVSVPTTASIENVAPPAPERDRPSRPSARAPRAERPAQRAPQSTPTPELAARPTRPNPVDPALDPLTPPIRRDPGPSLPATPSRAEVMSALEAVRPAVTACAQNQHGLALVRIAVAGSSGRVTNATVSGELAGTPVGSCVARAARGASFPRFSQSTFTINYPFRL